MLLAPPSPAETHRVGPPGEGDYPTIQEAVAVCADGDTVLILPGTYTGPDNRDIDPGTANIHVCSQDGRGSVTIDCEGLGRAFHIHGGQDTTMVLEGIEIAHGAGSEGAAILVEEDSGLKLAECSVLDTEGSAVRIDGGCLIITDSGFLGTPADVPWPPWPDGGCIRASNSTVRISDCAFVANREPIMWYGGALCVNGCEVMLSDCSFERYRALYGGACAATDSDVTLLRCSVTSCSTAEGGALWFETSAATIGESTFKYNESENGSAIRSGTTSLDVRGSTFCDNHGSGYEGAQVYLDGGARLPVTLTGCTMTSRDVWGMRSGFVRAGVASPVVTRCVFAFSNIGPVMSVEPEANPEFTNCVVFAVAEGDSLPGTHYDNLFIDPLFCDVEDDDLGLCSNSPCLPDGNPWQLHVGSEPEECGNCSSPVKPVSWGAIKAMYR